MFIAQCNIGISFSSLGDFESSLKHLRQSLGYAIHLEDLEAQSLVCDNLAVMSLKREEFSVAKMYFLRRLKTVTQLGDTFSATLIYQHLGELMVKWKGTNSGEAKEMLEKAIQLAERNNFDLILMESHSQLALLENANGEYESSLEHCRKALNIAELKEDEKMVRKVKCEMGIAEGNLQIEKLEENAESHFHAWNEE